MIVYFNRYIVDIKKNNIRLGVTQTISWIKYKYKGKIMNTRDHNHIKVMSNHMTLNYYLGSSDVWTILFDGLQY